ncbi:putative phage abortive infection protein [Enterococcus faecium]|nr:putative phage abortive infection protein [Enterococcus faecium]
MKRKYFSWIAVGLVFVSLIAFTLALFKAEEGWLGFWGGIIGSAIGVLGAFLVLKEQVNSDREALKVQLEEEREQNKQQQIDNTFFNLLDMHTNLKSNFELYKYFDEFFDVLLVESEYKIRELGNLIVLHDQNILENLELLLNEYIEETKEKILDLEVDLDNIPNNRKDLPPYLIDKLSEQVYPETEAEIKTFIEASRMSDHIGDIIDFIDLVRRNEEQVDLMRKLNNIYDNATILNSNMREKLSVLVDAIKKYNVSNPDPKLIIKEADKIEIVNKVSNQYNSELGSYFRLTHRILKYINQNVKDESIKNNYLGFFRATIDEDELLVIFYNAYFSKRGKGLGRELAKTSFFGKEGELGEEDNFVQHFNRDNLLWPEEDLKIMRHCK